MHARKTYDLKRNKFESRYGSEQRLSWKECIGPDYCWPVVEKAQNPLRHLCDDGPGPERKFIHYPYDKKMIPIHYYYDGQALCHGRMDGTDNGTAFLKKGLRLYQLRRRCENDTGFEGDYWEFTPIAFVELPYPNKEIWRKCDTDFEANQAKIDAAKNRYDQMIARS